MTITRGAHLTRSCRVVLAGTLVIGATLLTVSCGAPRHRSGIFAEESTDRRSKMDFTSHPTLVEGNSTATSYGPQNLTDLSKVIDPDVRAVFVDFQPAQGSVVLKDQVPVSVRLAFTEPDRTSWEKLSGLRLGTCLINSEACAATLTRQNDGCKIDLGNYSCRTTGSYHVVVSLYDNDGRHYTKDWFFNYTDDIPHLSAIAQLMDVTPLGSTNTNGFRVILTDNVISQLVPYFEDVSCWSVYESANYSRIPVVNVKRSLSQENQLVVETSTAVDYSKLTVDFRPEGVSSYSFKTPRPDRSASFIELVDQHCNDCFPPAVREPIITQPVGILNEVSEEGPGAHPGNGSTCCNPAVCEYDLVQHTQCCVPRLDVYTGTCLTCPTYVVWRSGCQQKQGINPPEPPLPNDGRSDTSDDRPIGPCPGGYPAGPSGWQLFEVDPIQGIIRLRPTRMQKADYQIEIGHFRYDEHLQRTIWEACWHSPILHVDDLVNPVVTPSIISGSQMAQEITSGAYARTVRYAGNANYAPFNQLLAQYEGGCGKVLKINIVDKGFHPASTPCPPDLPNYYLDRFYRTPFKAWQDYDYYGFDRTNWPWLDPQLSCAWVCDANPEANYAKCDARDQGGVTENYTFYYLMPRDAKPFSEWANPWAPYCNGQGPKIISDCKVKDWWPVLDATQNNWGAGFYTFPSDLSTWDLNALLYKVRDDRVQDHGSNVVSSDFVEVSISKGTRLAPNLSILEVATQQDIEDGIPFAVFYNWTRDYSTPGPTLWGDPKLRMSLSQPYNNQTQIALIPAKAASGIDLQAENGCIRIESGFFTFPCMNLAVQSAYVEDTTICSEPRDLEEYPYGNAPLHVYAFGGIQTPPGLAHVTTQLRVNNPAASGQEMFILHNPAVSGGDLPIQGPFQKGPATGAGSGAAPYVYATFRTCKKPKDMVFYFDGNHYESIEDSLGQGFGNAYEERDSLSGDWRSYIKAQEPNRFFPPIYLNKLGDAQPAQAFHDDFKDLDFRPPYVTDTRDDIRRTHNGVNRVPWHWEQSDFDTDSPEFMVAWDGRQHMLDSKAMYIDRNGPLPNVPLVVSPEDDPTMDLSCTAMYPPGRYCLLADISFWDGSETELNLGTVYVTYGSTILNAWYLEHWDGGAANALTAMSGLSLSPSYYCGTEYFAPNWIGDVKFGSATLLTSTEYRSVVETLQHDRNWGFWVPRNWAQPVRKDLVILAECHRFNYREEGSEDEDIMCPYRVFIAWEHKIHMAWDWETRGQNTYEGPGFLWLRHFNGDFFKQSGPTVRAAYVSASQETWRDMLKYTPWGIPSDISNIPEEMPSLAEHTPGDADRTAAQFERTDQ